MATQDANLLPLPVGVSYEGKILPHQEFNSCLYEGKSDYMMSLFTLLDNHAAHVGRASFALHEHPRVGSEEMSTPPMQLAFLKFLIDITRSKKVLEIGTFIGNTSMHIANFIGPDAEVVTIEKFDEFASLAQKNFAANNLADRITLLQGDAKEQMMALPDNHFDLIYVDGDKAKYLELTQIAAQKIAPNGMIVVDDVFFHGDVMNDTPKTDKGLGCKAVLDYYKDTKHFSKYLLPINNGILLLHKAGA